MPDRPKAEITDADELIKALSVRSGMQVYRLQTGGWALTYGAGRVSSALIATLIGNGTLRSCYSNCPDDAYWLGRTIDVDATVAKRLASRNRKDVVYSN